jgi:hypothetical protein
MVRLYCDHHNHTPGRELCADCTALLDYARQRLRACPFQERKSTCAKCPIHCYMPEKRDQMREVMRYAGPRMILHHPILTVRHLVDGLRRPPSLKNSQNITDSA